jgi:DNA repair exonuclease SbcCD ATPase subunit
MKEIESQEDIESIDDICGIEREVIEMEARSFETLASLRLYFEKVCGFYSERVAILMKEVHKRLDYIFPGDYNSEVDHMKQRIEDLEE